MRGFILSIGIGLIFNPMSSMAFQRSDGVTVRCEIEHQGRPHTVEEIWLGHGDQGDRHPELGGAAAVVRPDKQGRPVIYFDSVVFKGMLEKDPHMSDFIFYHECAHAQDERRNEIEANCEAYLELDKLGMLTAERIQALAATHTKMRRLPSRYGGSGEVFWEKTLACVNNRTENSVVR
jgi:hypothetical protein